jgi:lipoprotein-releasing system permease protein
MSPNFRIALRFLTAKKRAMLMSLSCIVLGVGLFIVTQATTSGFQAFFIKTILGTNGAIMIQDKLQATMRSIDAGGYNSPLRDPPEAGQKYIEGIEYPEILTKGLETLPQRLGRLRGAAGNGHDPQLVQGPDRPGLRHQPRGPPEGLRPGLADRAGIAE